MKHSSGKGRIQTHRSGWLRIALPAAVLLTALIAVLAPLAVARVLPVWASATLTALMALALFVPIRGRVLLVEWPAVLLAYLRRRRRWEPALPPVVETDTVSGTAGVRADGYTLVAAIEVAPDLAITVELGGRAHTTSTLGLDLAGSLMRHYDIDIDIDIVSDGCLVPPGTAYRTVYSQFVGPHPLPGERRTYLVLRMDVQKNLRALAARGPARIHGPRALATIALRSAQRLQQERLRAHVLTRAELDELSERLLEPVTGHEVTERWGFIESGLNYVSSYVCAPAAELSAELIDQWWSWRTEATLMVLRLAYDQAGEIRAGAFVRYVTHGEAYRPLPEASLTLPTGVQLPMLESGLPLGDRSLQVSVPTSPAAALSGLELAIGPAGQIVGQIPDGSTVAIPMWDQSGRAQRRRVEARMGLDVAHQIVLRAMVTGASVALHVEDRARWDGLVAAVADNNRLFYPTAGSRPSDIAVFDGKPISAVSARTVLRLLAEGESASSAADLVLTELAGHALQVAVAGQAPVVVQLVRTREEDRYLGLAQVPAPPRRPEPVPPSVARPHRPVPARPAVAAQQPPPRPAAAAPRGGRLDIAGPERVRRGPAAPAAPQPQPTPARRREFRLPTPEDEDRRRV